MSRTLAATATHTDQNERGAALITALCLISILMISVISSLSLGVSALHAARNEAARSDAFNQAQSVLDAVIEADSTSPPDLGPAQTRALQSGNAVIRRDPVEIVPIPVGLGWSSEHFQAQRQRVSVHWGLRTPELGRASVSRTLIRMVPHD